MKTCLVPLAWIVGVALSAAPLAGQVEVATTTVDGTVPDTAITYTITATGTAREIWAPDISDGGVWEWFNGFPEFVGTGGQTLTVDFSAPVPIHRLVLGVNSISLDPFTLTVSGGTATTADFDLADGIAAAGAAGTAAYNGATGEFTITGPNQSLMIGSSSSNTITQLSITGNGGGDGHTLFFGTTQVVAPAVTEIPTVNTVGLSLLGLLLAGAAFFVIRRV
jgi:hypothetical protein